MDEDVDYHALLASNLVDVFSERDPARRMAAISRLYAADAIFHEPDASFTGHAAISGAVDKILSSLPPDFAFAALGKGAGHNGVGKLRWRVGAPGGPAAVTGTDVIQVTDGRIRILHVFLDPKGE